MQSWARGMTSGIERRAPENLLAQAEADQDRIEVLLRHGIDPRLDFRHGRLRVVVEVVGQELQADGVPRTARRRGISRGRRSGKR